MRPTPTHRRWRRREPVDLILVGLIAALACVLGATLGYALGELIEHAAKL